MFEKKKTSLVQSQMLYILMDNAEDSDRQVLSLSPSLSLSPESHWVINVWMTHLIVLHSYSQSFWDSDVHHSSLSELSVPLSSLSDWKLSAPHPPFALNPEQRIQENSTK